LFLSDKRGNTKGMLTILKYFTSAGDNNNEYLEGDEEDELDTHRIGVGRQKK